MIRFYQYIAEAEISKEEIFEAIQKDCKPFLKAIDNNVFSYIIFRGTKDLKNFMKKKVRMDRKPLDTKKQYHKLLDDELYKKFKIRGRTKCIFVTGNKIDARRYGNIYSIFPIGNFKFIWSPMVKDYTYKLKHLKQTNYEINDLSPVIKSEIVGTYQTTDLKKAIKSGNEIMISCKEYYAIYEDMFHDFYGNF